MSKFEDHLWREFAREHGPDVERAGRPRARHSRLRPRVLAGGSLGLAGVGATVALVLGAASTSPAFAVTRHQDGTVTVWVKRSDGVAGANAKLHQLGIRAMVMPQAPVRCSDLPITQLGAPTAQGKNLIAPRGSVIAHTGEFPGAHWTIDRKVPAGQMLALTPAPAPSLTPSPAPGGSNGSSETTTTGTATTTTGTGTTSGATTTGAATTTTGTTSGTTTTGGNGGEAGPNWTNTAGQVWTCNVPSSPDPGAGNSGNS